jgi:hypothetical protein
MLMNNINEIQLLKENETFAKILIYKYLMDILNSKQSEYYSMMDIQFQNKKIINFDFKSS